MLTKSILVWLCIVPLAFVNAGLRELVFTPLIGPIWAHPLSGLTLIGLIFALSLWLVPKLGRGTAKTYRVMGLLWIALTMLFETGMGLLLGRTMGDIASAYDPTTGNLWLLVVLFTGCAPGLAIRIKGC